MWGGVERGGVGVSGAISIQRPGEREEGGQRGTEDDILSRSDPRRLSPSQHDSSVRSLCLSLLFFLIFSQSPQHLVRTPPTLVYLPLPSYQTVVSFWDPFL